MPICNTPKIYLIKIQLNYNIHLLNSEIDNLAIKITKKSKKNYYGKFRSIYGNDEIIFDSPGYNKNNFLTRYPFREYHTVMILKISIKLNKRF